MRVALLTNFVGPYRVPVFRALRDRVGALRIFAATSMEQNRQWKPDVADLDVVVQKAWSYRKAWIHPRFRDEFLVHVPYDTLTQLRRFRPDVIITGQFGAASIQAILYAKTRGIPVVAWATLTDHLEEKRGNVRTILRKSLLRHVDRVIVNGESGARYITSMGQPASKSVKIPQTTDIAPFLQSSLPRSKPRRLFYVGQLSQLKGLELLFDALKEISIPLELVMVGAGPLQKGLQQVELPPNVTVEWRGFVGYDELPKVYAEAGILIFPTFGDEWGLVVNEALASGVPVIGSNYSQAVEELVKDGENGWRFSPDTAEAVRNIIVRALQTPDERLMQMRQNARDSVRRLTANDVASRMHEVLVALLS